MLLFIWEIFQTLYGTLLNFITFEYTHNMYYLIGMNLRLLNTQLWIIFIRFSQLSFHALISRAYVFLKIFVKYILEHTTIRYPFLECSIALLSGCWLICAVCSGESACELLRLWRFQVVWLRLRPPRRDVSFNSSEILWHGIAVSLRLTHVGAGQAVSWQRAGEAVDLISFGVSINVRLE